MSKDDCEMIYVDYRGGGGDIHTYNIKIIYYNTIPMLHICNTKHSSLN